MLARPLEEKYPSLRSFENIQDVKWIVVLGGGSGVDPGLPLSTYLSEASMARLSEGVFIHSRLPETKLIMTGRSGFEGITPVAEVMAETAGEWGVKLGDIIIEAEAVDTKDHPIYVKKIVGSDKFILVTSAAHMPRVYGAFQETWDGTHSGANGLYCQGARRGIDARGFLSEYRVVGEGGKGDS